MNNELKPKNELVQNKYKRNKDDDYKTVRITPKDYRFLKDWAYFGETTIINRISFLINNYKKDLLLEKENTVKSIYFLSKEHKDKFIAYLMTSPLHSYENNYLLAFYTNAAANIFTEEIIEPMSWTGEWNKEKTMFTQSKKFLAMEKEEQQFVDFAMTLYDHPDPANIIKKLADIEPANLPLAQAMIRLRLNGLGM